MSVQDKIARQIFLIDDDEGICELLKEILEDASYTVSFVHRGDDALSRLETTTPFLIILDYGLPDMNGTEFITQLRQQSPILPPFIVSTGQGDENIAVEMMKLGALDYVVKNNTFLDILPEVVKRIEKEIRNEEKLKQAKEQLFQSHKMEAIGKLAGGIAHDFNNMLTGIIGAAYVLQNRVQNNPEANKFIDIIIQSSERAASLTAKLLAFGRKGKTATAVFDLHKIIQETIELLKRSIDKRIEIVEQLDSVESLISGDASQLQNALLNIGINASQAIPAGGKITLTTKIFPVTSGYANASTFPLQEADYLSIEIRDTGTGIPAEYITHIFEPFFTTKQQGEGTGLGLSAVYGTIQDHAGEITVRSAAGEGTCFRILLPLAKKEPAPQLTDTAIQHGCGTILFVDDEKSIRITVKVMLEELGYRVILAATGKEAVDTYRDKGNEIQLVILDMNMPVMDGKDAMTAIRKRNPECKIIISSGYTKEEEMVFLREAGINGHIKKPYRIAALSELIASVL